MQTVENGSGSGAIRCLEPRCSAAIASEDEAYAHTVATGHPTYLPSVGGWNERGRLGLITYAIAWGNADATGDRPAV